MPTLLSIITPVNLHEERERFLTSTEYHPQFRYRWNEPEHLVKLQRQQHTLPISFVQAILNQEPDRIHAEAERYFHVKVLSEVLSLAKEIVSVVPERRKKPPVAEIAAAFVKAFEHLGLGYDVTVSHLDGFFFRPNHRRKEFVISEHVELSFFSLDGALKHEVTHVIRSVNSVHNGISPSSDYLPTEEGLASYMQDYHGVEGEKSLFQHAAEYVASSIGMEGSLRDIFDFFRSIGFSKKLAWQRAARHKFGFRNTALPGDILKPAMYFYQEQRIRQLSDEQRWTLFSGKISLDELRSVGAYRGVIPLEKLIAFYRTSH